MSRESTSGSHSYRKTAAKSSSKWEAESSASGSGRHGGGVGVGDAKTALATHLETFQMVDLILKFLIQIT